MANEYLGSLTAGCRSGKDSVIADLLSIPSLSKQGVDDLMNAPGAVDFPWSQRILSLNLPADWGSVFCANLEARVALQQGRFRAAFDAVSSAYRSFLKMFETPSEEYWLKEVLRILCVNVRLAGRQSDRKEKGGDSTYKKVQELLTLGTKNTQVSRAMEKKEAAIGVFNQLFKVYFEYNALGWCNKLFRSAETAVYGRGKLDFNSLPLAQQVTYKFFLGRMAIFEEKYKTAEQALEFALSKCIASHTKNRRSILFYLIPIKLYFGKYPPEALLRKHHLLEYQGIVRALRSGNPLMFRNELQRYQVSFLSKGLYLLLEQLKATLYRNMLFTCYKILANNKINLKSILPALLATGNSMELGELECIVCNLIQKGFVKGYVSHKEAYLVMSKSEPFPKLSVIGDRRRSKEQ